jgi:hypothetical protein
MPCLPVFHSRQKEDSHGATARDQNHDGYRDEDCQIEHTKPFTDFLSIISVISTNI